MLVIIEMKKLADRLSHKDKKELDKIAETYQKEGGEELLRYHLGELPYGYLKMCKYCRGFGEDNHYVVRGGIQLSK